MGTAKTETRLAPGEAFVETTVVARGAFTEN